MQTSFTDLNWQLHEKRFFNHYIFISVSRFCYTAFALTCYHSILEIIVLDSENEPDSYSDLNGSSTISNMTLV